MHLHLKKELVCVLPIIGKKSLKLRSKLVKSVKNNLRFCHLKVVFQSPNKLCTLFGFKDTLDKKICSDLLYLCSSCNAPYYGKTYRPFFMIAAGISNLTGKCIKNVKVSDQPLQCDCTIDSDHFDILAPDTNSFRFLIKERVC